LLSLALPKYNQIVKPVILFDIDRTLIDTDKFSQTYRKKFIKFLGIPPKKLEKILAKYYSRISKHTDFVPEEFIKHLINSLHKNNVHKIYEKLHNLFFESENFSKNLYPDTLPVLKDLKKHYSLGIFSEGHPVYQKTKLVKSNLYDLFNPKYVYIFHRKTSPESLAQISPDTIIIDDDSSVISEIPKNFYPVWLNRKNKDKLPHTKTIHSLLELTL
jgi:phosphoglycolate phosphatase-like HAD superfamily hydrolase